MPNLVSDGVVVIQVLLLTLMTRRCQTRRLSRPHAAAQRGVGGRHCRRRIFIVLVDGIGWLLGRDIVTQFQLDIYRTASAWLPWRC